MTYSSTSSNSPTPLLTLIDLGHRARIAQTEAELGFLLVNDTRQLLPYRQAVLWFTEGGVRCLSGVIQPEANTPYTLWLNKVCQSLAQNDGNRHPVALSSNDVPPRLADEWAEWFPNHALWINLPASPNHPGSIPGGLLLAGDSLIDEALHPLVSEWVHMWHHAWLARHHPKPWSFALWKEKYRAWLRQDQRGGDEPYTRSPPKWWQRRQLQITLGLAAVSFFPVHLSVLAPGELVPANPAVIRAPLDGVIDQFHIRPNQQVKAGQILFSFDEAPIASRLEVARQALATAEAEYRQQAQLALTDSKSKGQLAILMGKIGEKRAEAEFLESQFQRSHVASPQDGIAIFDDPAEWVGRPIQVGERIMKVATPNDVEIEAWIPIGDAIPLPEDAKVSLYLAATPFASISGQLRYLGHEAQPRPDGNYGYRLRAKLDKTVTQRVGLKGTAKVQGNWVPLVYWILRRPLAITRQFLVI